MIFVVLELVAVAVQFRPYHLNRHVILPQRAKLHRNRATCDLPQSSLVVHVTGMQSDGMLVNKSSQNSKDLTEPQTASTEHNGMYVDSLAQCRQYLLESQSTQAAGSRFPYLVVPSSASQQCIHLSTDRDWLTRRLRQLRRCSTTSWRRCTIFSSSNSEYFSAHRTSLRCRRL